MSDTPSLTIALNDDERRTIIFALEDKTLDLERYLMGSQVDKTPTEQDTCCEVHLARYQQRREAYLALKKNRRFVRQLIRRLEKGVTT